MRCAVLLVAFLALSSSALAQPEQPRFPRVEKFVNDLKELVQQKRQLLWTPGQNAGSVQSFFSDIFGGNWTQNLPSQWAQPSFTWEQLGSFEYSSNMQIFLDAVTNGNLTKPQSLSEWHSAMDEVTKIFCTPETFVPSQKVYAACVGPKIVLEYVPKVCILDEESRQVVCDPAKLVLSKTPGGCTHKYNSPSVWTGKECKISGGVGLTQNSWVYGGNTYPVPLTTVDISVDP